MSKFRKFLKKVTSRAGKIAGISAVAVVTVAAIPVLARASWGPNRPVFDWNNQSQRVGSLNGPVFNSFINTPYYGDERTFFDARFADSQNTGQNYDALTGINSEKEVILRTYVHNNANQGTNASGAGVAHDAKVRVALPAGYSNKLQATSYISASNAAEVFDTVDLEGANAFSVSYVPGSARLYNAANANGFTLNDSIVSGGALIGYNQMNGDLPGCFEYQAVVEIKVKIVTPKQEVTKKVRKEGSADWVKQTEVTVGDKVQWYILVKNAGSIDLDDVTVYDQLPPHLSVVPGSVRYIDAAQDVAQQDQPLFTGGINFKTWKPNGGFYIRFDTIAKNDLPTDQCEVTIRNLAHVHSKQIPQETTDYADVKIKKSVCNPPAPVFACTALTVNKLTRTSFKFTVNGTASNGANITGYIFKVNGNTVSDSTSNNFTYNQETPGTYNVEAFVKTDKGTTTSTSVCMATIKVEEKPTAPTYACNLITVTTNKQDSALGERQVKVAVNASAEGGATITNYTYDFGDQTAAVTSNQNPYTYTYAKAGKYTIKVTVNVLANGTPNTATSKNCESTVEFTVVIPPTVVPPTELPKTGAGSLAGMFAGVSTLGAAVHSVSRRFRRK